MTNISRTDEFKAVVCEFMAKFAAGDADGVSGLFAADASLMLLDCETIFGREAICSVWQEAFALSDYSSLRYTFDVIDVHDDRAYVLAEFTETIKSKQRDVQRPDVYRLGRIVMFWVCEHGQWLVRRSVTARSALDVVLK